MNETRESSSLEGRVALVTGGARGIGLAISRALYARGASVLIADSGASIDGTTADPAVASAAASELGERALAFSADIASPENASAAVALAVSHFGAIDLVVNNAAIVRDSFIFKGNPAHWDAVLRTDLSAAFYVLAAATPNMRDQVKAGRAPGRIVNISSSAGLYGNYGLSGYASAKAGLLGLTRVVAMDMARSGVTCNAVAPFGATRVTEAIVPANPAQAQYKERALKVEPRFVGDFIAFLAGDAAKDITGQLFVVRGREVLLFSQPRPIERFVVPEGEDSVTALSALVQEQRFATKRVELTTDLEAFNMEPIT
ncbi:MAG TPA: SDR family NAD(P)-dependent oxidoreductase [Polyangiaceae bacterium]|nr:SDR family NAD(P)-dependent oxidoreductase [Polyangiaceae bacterium]